MNEEHIWNFRSGNKRYNICYVKEAMRHPAKMEIEMCRKIIKTYSKVGELILDCMAGIFTTGIEGSLLGRNVIGIEYEQKFVDLAQKNIEQTNKQMGFMKRGKAIILKGDARDIIGTFKANVEILKGNHGIDDSVVFSPPFAEMLAGSSKDDTLHFTHGAAGKDYGTDPENIGNLKYHSSVGAVIFSPPFASIEKAHDKEWYNKNIPRPSNDTEGYSDDKKDENQIANLKYHGSDGAVIFSPPYAEGNQAKGPFKEHPEDCLCAWCRKCKGNAGEVQGLEYSNNSENIGNQKYGDVDAVIMSPPFMQENKGGGIHKDIQDGIKRKGQTKHDTELSTSEDNIDNMKGKNYLTEMFRVYKSCFDILKPQGCMVLVLKNFIRKGKEIRLDLDTIKLCELAGFKHIAGSDPNYPARHRRFISNPSFWVQNYRKKNKNAVIIDYEDILVFVKPSGEGGGL